MYDYVIIGGGLSGCCTANLLANRGKKVLIVEKRKHIGGNLYDEYDKKTGVIVQRYGPHIFHTNDEQVYDFVKDKTEWVPFILKCGACLNGVFTPSPFNYSTIDQFFQNGDEIKREFEKEYPDEDYVTIVELLNSPNRLLQEYALFLFEQDYSLYTAKQWGIPVEKVDVNVLKRVPVRKDYKECYFVDKYQMMPKKGFSSLISSLIHHKNISIMLNVNCLNFLKFEKDKVIVTLPKCENSSIIFTGPIDSLFNYKFGLLPYRSLSFRYKRMEKRNFQPYPVVAYPKARKYTRITDFNYLNGLLSNSTVIAYEYPRQYSLESTTDPYYPINNDESQKLYNMYLQMANQYSNLYLVGRLANYKYYNMDQIIKECILFSESISMQKF